MLWFILLKKVFRLVNPCRTDQYNNIEVSERELRLALGKTAFRVLFCFVFFLYITTGKKCVCSRRKYSMDFLADPRTSLKKTADLTRFDSIDHCNDLYKYCMF